MSIEMGKRYWRLDGSTATRETLISTLESFGLTAVKEHSIGDELFKRVVDWQSQNSIQFSTIWYVNLCHIRIGEWGGDFADINFDSIVGSYWPFYEHDTIDFMYNDNPMFRLALKRM